MVVSVTTLISLIHKSLVTLEAVDDKLEPFKFSELLPDNIQREVAKSSVMWIASHSASYQSLIEYRPKPFSERESDVLSSNYGSITLPSEFAPEMAAAIQAGIGWTIEKISEGQLFGTQAHLLALDDCKHCIRHLKYKKDGQFQQYFTLVD